VHQNDAQPQGMMNAAVQPETLPAIPAASAPPTAMVKKSQAAKPAKGKN